MPAVEEVSCRGDCKLQRGVAAAAAAGDEGISVAEDGGIEKKVSRFEIQVKLKPCNRAGEMSRHPAIV